jgi:hypothetical protein
MDFHPFARGIVFFTKPNTCIVSLRMLIYDNILFLERSGLTCFMLV